MPLLHLVDRPGDATRAIEPRHGVGALVSGASHFVIALLALLAFRAASDPIGIPSNTQLDPSKLIWMINPVDGGGRAGGGNQSTTPARRAQSIGNDSITVPSAPAQSATTTTAEPPTETPTINARPMGNSMQMFAGAIGSDSTTTTLGPGIGPGTGGDGDGSTDGTGRGPGFGPGVHRGGPGVTTPIVIHQVKPQYTAEAMRARLQGAVWLECVVLPDGSVGDVRVTRSLDRRFGLDDQAVIAAKQWRFRPGLLKGQPVPVFITIELSFSVR